MRKLIVLATLLLSAITTNAHADPYDDEIFSKMPYLKPYGELLTAYVKPHTKNGVKGTGVDYLSWQNDPKHNEAVNLLTNTDTSQLESKEEKMSFWINAYNLLTIDLIIRHGEKETIHNLGGLVGDPWNEFSWVINGLEFTLAQIHNQMLGPLTEPRTHFTLSCAAVSCPDLRNKPYYPKRMYSQLNEQTAQFLKNPAKGVKIHIPEKTKSRIKEKPTFKAAQIFEWYINDFNRGKFEKFIDRYVDIDGIRFDGYLDHDWTLNALEGREPNKVKTTLKTYQQTNGTISFTANPYN